MVLLALTALVYMHADTLYFGAPGQSPEAVVLAKRYGNEDPADYHVEEAMVSPDSLWYVVHESRYLAKKKRIETNLSLYDVNRRKTWSWRVPDGQTVPLDLVSVFRDGLLVFVVTDEVAATSTLRLVRKSKMQDLKSAGVFRRVKQYVLSPNQRHVLLHVVATRRGRPWDHVSSIDLETLMRWDYPFPYCFSCRRGRIDLAVDDQGVACATYRNEVRVFERSGELREIRLIVD